MTIKLRDISRFKKWAKGETLVLPGGPEPRIVRLEVLSGGVLHIADERTTEPVAVVVPEAEILEFTAQGDVYLERNGAKVDAFYATMDGQAIAYESDLPEFTQIIMRKTRNDNLQRMIMLAQFNMEQRLQQQAREIEAAFERRLAAREEGADEQTGEVGDGAGSGSASSATGASTTSAEQPSNGAQQNGQSGA